MGSAAVARTGDAGGAGAPSAGRAGAASALRADAAELEPPIGTNSPGCHVWGWRSVEGSLRNRSA